MARAQHAGWGDWADDWRTPVVPDSHSLRKGIRMSYLTCPSCSLTLLDRNPLTSPRFCPRCARRSGDSVELERIRRPGAGAAASVLGGGLRRDAEQWRRSRGLG